MKLLFCKCLALQMEGNEDTDGAMSDHCPCVRVQVGSVGVSGDCTCFMLKLVAFMQ